MDLGLFAPLRSPACTPAMLTDLGQQAEEMGIHSLWMGEHVVLFDRYESRYPGSPDGSFQFPEGSGLLDMTATLGFLAACTRRLRLGTGIRILPQGNPVYTAKEYATLDYISGGRIDFGVGVGWSWEEYAACGADWARRGARCNEYLEVIRSLWCDERSSFRGEFYDLPECIMYPKPVQQPMVPIIVGGHSDAALRRAARYGAGWFGINLLPADVVPMVDKLRANLAEEGRDGDAFRIVIGSTSLEMRPEFMAGYGEAGVSEVLVPYMRQSHKWLSTWLHSMRPFLDAANAAA